MISLKSPAQTKQKSKQKDVKIASNKSHYKYNSKLYDLNLNPTAVSSPTNSSIVNIANNAVSHTAFDQKLGVTRAKDPIAQSLLNDGNFDGTKSSVSLSVDKNTNKSMSDLRRSVVSTSKKLLNNQKDKNNKDSKQLIKLPPIRKSSNPEDLTILKAGQIFYQSKIQRSFRLKQNTYMMNLARQHFLQCVQAIKIGKNMKLSQNPKVFNLSKKNPKFKTIYLDLDQTLIHCDESSNNYTVRLNFPVEGGATIQAGIRVRPFCNEFLEQLSSFAQIIIFTASSPSYADVVLDYLDPKKKYFAHRLYRQHCTLQKGFYTKDLRIVNRRPQDVAIVDNSGFSFMTQPQFGIPILPFYHFVKDRQLQSLIKFLRQLIEEPDMRQKIKRTFYWQKYTKGDGDPRTIFQQNFHLI